MKIYKDWNFGGEVPGNFYEHISNSIPNYKKIHDYVISFCEYFCFKESKLLDVGSSTGELPIKIYDEFKERNIDIDCYEVEHDMFRALKKNINGKDIKIFNESIENIIEGERYDLVTCIFTLQFMKHKERSEVLRKIFECMNEGSYMLLAEKVISKDSRVEAILSSILRENKIKSGLTEESVLKKEFSLRGVMNCKTEDEIIKEIECNGFRSIELLLKENSFNLYLVRK